MKTVRELKISEGSLIECSQEIIKNMIRENKWEKTFIPDVLDMNDEIKMSVINTYEHLIYQNTPIHIIRATLDGIVIPHQSNWGGAREGAGRPSTGRKKRNIYVTDEEHEQIRELLEQLRKPSC